MANSGPVLSCCPAGRRTPAPRAAPMSRGEEGEELCGLWSFGGFHKWGYPKMVGV